MAFVNPVIGTTLSSKISSILTLPIDIGIGFASTERALGISLDLSADIFKCAKTSSLSILPFLPLGLMVPKST